MERVSNEKLFEITRYKQKSKQIDWLQQRGIPFQLDRFKHPVVFEEHLLGNKTASKTSANIVSKKKWEPPPLN